MNYFGDEPEGYRQNNQQSYGNNYNHYSNEGFGYSNGFGFENLNQGNQGNYNAFND